VPHKQIVKAMKAAGFTVRQETIPSTSEYGEETLFFGTKP
jgi:hypothetical protein